MNMLRKLGFLALALIAFNASAQTDKVTTTKIVGDTNYVFVATAAIPLSSTDINKVLGSMTGSAGAGVINLTGGSYDVKFSGDSVVAYLPYYGRAYRATFDNDENGYKFTSKKYSYTSTKRKKGGWDILVNTNDVKDNVRMNLSIGESGYATLVVSSNNRQSITFNGYLNEVKKKSP